jgi:hypothetical protein
MKMSSENGETAVEVRKPQVAMTVRGVELTTIDDAWRFCDAIAKTEMVPKSMRGKPAEVFAVVQAGAELGLTPFRALSNMKIINGRVGPMGALAKALVRKEEVLEKGTGFMEKYSGTEGEDDWTAHFSTLRKGETERYHTTFSVKDAKLAKLWGKTSRGGEPGPWVLYPKRMLMWRAVGFHMDDYYADVLMGFHIAEVLEDYPEEVPRGVATMEPLETPAKDPLLDDLDAKFKAEMDEVAAELQPEPQDPIDPDDPADSEITVDGEVAEAAEDMADLDPPTEETKEDPPPASARGEEPPLTEAEIVAARERKGRAAKRQSPLAAVMAEKHAEAGANTMADTIRDGLVDVKDEDLDDPNPENAAPEGAETEELF